MTRTCIDKLCQFVLNEPGPQCLPNEVEHIISLPVDRSDNLMPWHWVTCYTERGIEAQAQRRPSQV